MGTPSCNRCRMGCGASQVAPSASALHEACEAGDAAQAAQLIKKGANLDAKDSVRPRLSALPAVAPRMDGHEAGCES